MDSDRAARLAAEMVDAGYVKQGTQSLKQREKGLVDLLSQRRLPSVPWTEHDLTMLLMQLSTMDSNNFHGSVGLGEREARVVCDMVRRRHFGLGHGIGRSGDVAAIQPKAAGSSLLNVLTSYLTLHALKLAGLTRTSAAVVLPMATGMSVTLTMLTLKASRPDAKYVIWPRIDQKSCFKAIGTSGLTPVVVEEVLVGDELRTDVDAVSAAIDRVGAANVLCVLSTTSCFAPRATDSVVELAGVCADKDVPHVINNAYGVQSSKICHSINEACRTGRVDAYVQSTDKNFMVPVGGAVVASPSAEFVDAVRKTYPGRASMSPILDMFLTLMSLGEPGWKRLLAQRKAVFPYLNDKLKAWADAHGERVLVTSHNSISIAVSLDTLAGDPTYFGSMAFSRGVSGMRVVKKAVSKTINGVTFTGYGSHADAYPHVYFTAAAAMGLTTDDVDVFVDKLTKVFKEYRKKMKKGEKGGSGGGSDGAGAGAGTGTGAGSDAAPPPPPPTTTAAEEEDK